MNQSKSTATMNVLILLNRLALGWYFIVAGWGKLGMEFSGGLGSFYQSDSFQGRNPDWLPALIAAPYGYGLPWAELVFGLLLAVGLFSRTTAGVLAVILVSIMIALFNAGQLLPSHHAMVFVPLALWLAVVGPGRYSVDAWWQGTGAVSPEPTTGAVQT